MGSLGTVGGFALVSPAEQLNSIFDELGERGARGARLRAVRRPDPRVSHCATLASPTDIGLDRQVGFRAK